MINAFAFYDDNNNLYFTDTNMDDIVAGYDRKILSADYTNNSSISFSVYDFNNNICINTASTPVYGENNDVSASPVVCAVNDKCAFVSVFVYSNKYESETNMVYVWHYNSNAENTPFNVDRLNNDGIKNKNSLIADELKKEYGINICIDKKEDESYIPSAADEISQIDDSDLVLGAVPLKVYFILTQLQAFLTYFPDGFVTEMYTNYINSDNNHDGFDIYIVKEIKDDSAAFANGWGNIAIITFATDEFIFDHLAHEFMHIIEFRIFDYYESIGSSFDDEWNTFVPAGFSYYSDYNEYNDDTAEYFISAYAMTDQYEDRAELFMRLFSDAYYNTVPDWYTGKMKTKTDCLCKAIRNAYPSVKNMDNVYWEKHIDVN